jgi:Zn-dependent protease
MLSTQLTTVQLVSVWVLPVLFAITVHEVAHGYVAYLLGDKTARVLGRLTLNPVKNIDLLGTVILPLILLILGGIVIGWAKPVPVNSRNFSRPRRDLALVSAAGPLANLLMAIIWALIAKLGSYLLAYGFPGALAVYMMGGAGIAINLMLMVLNLLPVPQLDGGHLIAAFLPRALAVHYDRLSPYGFFILLILVVFGAVTTVIQPVVSYLIKLISYLFGL